MTLREETILQALQEEGLYRQMRVIEAIDGVRFVCEGRSYLNFGSNNYLNLAQHPRVIRAVKDTSEIFGVGAQASRYVCGNFTLHEQVENKLTDWLKAERALLCNTGYMANLAAISSLVKPEDLVLLDRSCHASLIDAVKLSQASYKIFRHNDCDHLEQCLKRYYRKGQMLWVITESLFSMEGDCSPIKDIVKLKKNYAFRIIVDEAHALGVFGDSGEGWVVQQGCSNEVDVRVVSLGKAIGVAGGAVLSSHEVIDCVLNRGRTSIYSTGLALPLVGGLLSAIDLARHASQARDKLWRLIGELEGCSPVIPVFIPGNAAVQKVSQDLWDKGYYVPAMRFPTVSKGKECLRLSLSSGHSMEDIECFKKIMTDIM